MSITLDPKYAKAYHRRATARMNLGKLKEARADYQKLLELEPESKLAQIELNKLENQLVKNNLVFPVIKSENEKSKKPLVRIKIEEINVEESSAERIKLKQNIIEIQQKVKLSEKDEELFNINKKETDQGASKSFDSNLPKRIVSELKVDQMKINPQPKVIPECPKNAYQFKKDWQYLCENLENLAVYFKVY
jgi:tetratricopeptide (TPR) repeat protein